MQQKIKFYMKQLVCCFLCLSKTQAIYPWVGVFKVTACGTVFCALIGQKLELWLLYFINITNKHLHIWNFYFSSHMVITSFISQRGILPVWSPSVSPPTRSCNPKAGCGWVAGEPGHPLPAGLLGSCTWPPAPGCDPVADSNATSRIRVAAGPRNNLELHIYFYNKRYILTELRSDPHQGSKNYGDRN